MPSQDAGGPHKCVQAPKLLIGVRVKSNADPVADSSCRVRGQASHMFEHDAVRFDMAVFRSSSPLVQFGHFDFDFVHDQNCGQDDVFYTTVRPLVHKLIEVCMLVTSCSLCQ